MGQCFSPLLSFVQKSSASHNNWPDDEEPLARYVPGGYCAISIGDRVGVRARYHVLRKLGWGGRSTVWLVECTLNGTLYALKILTGNATLQTGSRELGLFHRTREASRPDNPDGRHLLHLHDHFLIESSNGKHLCLVLDLVASNVASYSLNWTRRRLPEELSKIIVRQCTAALDALHSCNIVHTDVKPLNISFVLPPQFDKWALLCNAADRQSVVETTPGGQTAVRFRTKPISYPLPSRADLQSAAVWKDVHVKVTNLGTDGIIMDESGKCKATIRNTALRPPEVCIGEPWNFSVDIWAIGCLAYELCIGQSLLPIGTDAYSVPYLHVLQFGPYPEDVLARSPSSPFTDSRLLQVVLAQRAEFQVSLESTIQKAGGAPPDRQNFLDFLRQTFALDQFKRPQAKDLIEHAWLN